MEPAIQHFDVIVIGGGPAGISTAFWCAEMGLSAALVEREAELGGQLLWTFGTIENYLGVTAKNGRQLRDLFVEQFESRKATRLTGADIEAADLTTKTIDLTNGSKLSGRTIVLATGIRRRTLGVPGETRFLGKGILDSGQRAGEEVVGKRVVIVGGGDAALENALILSETAAAVLVVHRRDRFTARDEFVSDACARSNVEFLFNTTVTEIGGNERVQWVGLANENGPLQIDCDHVLIRIGVEPNVELFKAAIELDARGYIRVNADCSTSMAGVYAVGDVACPVSPTIATAVGMGATAAKAIIAQLSKDQA